MIKVKIDHFGDPLGGVAFWIYETTETHISFWRQSLSGFEITRSERKEGMYSTATPSPTFVIPYQKANEFMKAMADEIISKGIGTEAEEGLRGRLEAKEAHLQDLRTLIFDKLLIKDRG